MKNLKLTRYKTKLFKFKLLKTKVYKNQKDFSHLLLKNTETRLKKILHIIYQFHTANKKILFIGAPLRPNNQTKELFEGKNRSFIAETIWVNGIITNLGPSLKHLLKRHTIENDKTSKLFFNLKNQVDLIIILDEKYNFAALKESSSKKVPIVSLNSNYTLLNSSFPTYRVTGNYGSTGKKIRNNLFLLFLSSLFKKAELIKKTVSNQCKA